MSANTALELEDVVFRYQEKGKRNILDHTSLSIPAGTLTVLMGGSGCGKSTLAAVAAGLYPENGGFLEGGTIRLYGQDLKTLDPQKRAAYLTVLFQNPDLQFCMNTLREEMRFCLENIRVPAGEMDARIDRAAAELGIAPLLDRTLSTLSGGEKQKAALSCLYVMESRCILLDESFANLDHEAAAQLLEMLLRMKTSGRTILAIDHKADLWLEAADEIILLEEGGKVAARGINCKNLPEHRTDFERLGLFYPGSRLERAARPVAEGKPLLQFRGVSIRKGLPTRRKWSRAVYDAPFLVQNADADFPAGCMTAVLGPSGTGKTTTVRGIVSLFRKMGLDMVLAAPTGRAAKRMGELCDRDAQTIHRMLGMTFNDQTGEVTFTKGEKEPLEADALIVDETSMVDLSLMRALLAALRPGCRLVLVGDPDQLPSVGAGNVFSDLIRSGRIATVALRDIFRQAEQSMIVRNAHLVNTGMPPKLKNAAANDFFFLPRRDSVRLVETVVELCKTRLPDKMGIPADELQVLTPTRRGDAGTRSLNFALQAALNPPKPGKQERRFGELIFREGDRVMQTRNDYDVVWQKEDGTAGTGIFNGDVGKIAKIDPSGELLEIVFDDRTATYTSDMLAELDMAYAMTVHKAQGSEYRGVVFVGAPCAPSLMVRGVLYTAITRARELLVIVGDDSAVNKMAENDRRSRRYSGLKWRLRKGGEEK